MSRWLKLASMALLGLGVVSCYPDRFDDTDNSTLDTVITQFNPETNFASAGTYALVDSVFHIVAEGEEDEIGRAFDNSILARVKSNMNAYGYTQIEHPDEANVPDLLVVVSAAAVTFTGVGYVPGYCWYPYDPYCWGYYPPGWAYTYEYTIGSVLITMLDRREPDMVAELLPVAWSAALNGPLNLTVGSQTQARLNDGIDQAFDQSPYLDTR